jgi:hypothetical protein
MCITAKAIFMVDLDDFGWLFMAGYSSRIRERERERGRERERENIYKKKCKQMNSE